MDSSEDHGVNGTDNADPDPQGDHTIGSSRFFRTSLNGVAVKTPYNIKISSMAHAILQNMHTLWMGGNGP